MEQSKSSLRRFIALAITLAGVGVGLALLNRVGAPSPPQAEDEPPAATTPSAADTTPAPTQEPSPKLEAPPAPTESPKGKLPVDPDLSLAWRRRGQARLELGEYASGLADLERALDLNPGDIPARFAAARCRAHLGDPGLALASFDELLRREPTHVGGHLHRGLIYSALGLSERAREEFDRALKGLPTPTPQRAEIEARLAKAAAGAEEAKALRTTREARAQETLARAGPLRKLTPDRALAICDEALAHDPASAEAYNRRGQIRHARREYEFALLDYTRSIAFNPNRGDAYSNRGLTYLSTKEPKLALVSFNQALDRPGPKGRFYQHRGWALARLSRLGEALADYQSAFEIAKTQPGTWAKEIATEIDRTEQAIQALGPRPKTAAEFLARGNELKRKGAFGAAVAELTEAIWRDSTLWRAYYKRGRCYVELQNYRKALSDLSQALNVGPPDQPWTYYAKGRALAKLNDDAGAIEAYTQAIALSPKHFSALYQRGRARMRAQASAGAASDLTRALELAPKNDRASILYYRGRVHATKGRDAEALSDFDRSLELTPLQTDVLVWRGLVRARDSDRAGAAADLRRARDLLSPENPQRAQIEEYLRQLDAD